MSDQDRSEKDETPSPEKRYEELEEERAAWSNKVEKSIRTLDRVTKRRSQDGSSRSNTASA